MSDTSTAETSKKTREAVAVRDWIDVDGKPLNGGDEAKAVGFRYTHLPTAKRLMPTYNPETDGAPAGAYFDFVCGEAGKDTTMLAIFGGLTLAGNVSNSLTNGPKGDPNADVISAVKARFEEITAGTWADRATGVGSVRYDKEKLAAAIAQAKGETDPAPYLAKMEHKVDAASGAVVPSDTKGAISYGAYALRNARVKAAYDTLTGGGTKLEAL